MRNVAIVENGIVTNIIAVALGKDGDKEITTRGGLDVTKTKVSIGWKHDGTKFVKPDPTPEELSQAKLDKETAAKKLSGRNKLLALGLTEAEVTALVG